MKIASAPPLASGAIAVQFMQPVAATDKLRAGRYGKVIRFTVSSTTP